MRRFLISLTPLGAALAALQFLFAAVAAASPLPLTPEAPGDGPPDEAPRVGVLTTLRLAAAGGRGRRRGQVHHR